MNTRDGAGRSEMTRGLGRWLGIALVASLCLNLIVAGAVASSYWSLRRSGEGGGGRAEGGGANFGRFAQTLPAERRAAVRTVAAEARKSIAPLRQQARLAREDVNRIIAAEAFDKEKLAAAHLAEIEAEAAVRKAVSRVVVEVVSELTPQERVSFVRWRETRPTGRGPRHGGDR